MKNQGWMISMGLVAGLTLGSGCKTHEAAEKTAGTLEKDFSTRQSGNGTIGVSEEVVMVESGKNWKIELTPKPDHHEWRFQWEKGGIDVIGKNSEKLDLQKIQLGDAGAYRCRIFSEIGIEPGETNYSREVYLQVIEASGPREDPKIKYVTITAPVAGPLQPWSSSSPVPAHCGTGSVLHGYVRYKCSANLAPGTGCRNDSIWWCFPIYAGRTPKVTITNTTRGVTGMKIAVIQSTDLALVKGACGTDTHSFENMPTVKYQIILYPSSRLPANTVITATVQAVY